MVRWFDSYEARAQHVATWTVHEAADRVELEQRHVCTGYNAMLNMHAYAVL
jgi:hypothetical protein